ncbi:MAG: ABC transporter substrate-binding protein [Alphaproteobacteria bacterium]|nr:ABC transporter substrate-binding protein [Alphaproteobacteria bacterium]
MTDAILNRRQVLAGAAALGAAQAAAPGASAQAPAGAVTASLLGNLPNIHPWHVANIETGAANLLVYSNLVRIAPDGGFVLDAAADMPTITNDGMHYTFKLRTDVRFHNGDRMTAEDVVYSWEKYLATARRRQNLGRFVDKVVAVEPHVVRVELKRPFAGWLKLMGYEAAIVRKGSDVVNEAATGENLYRGSRMAGSGPFIPKSFQADVSAEFEANPDYYGAKPRVGSVKLLRIPDAATQLANLRAGSVDIISNCPPKDFVPMSKTAGFKGGSRPSAGIFYSPLNRTKPPFDNVHLRKAFSCAVDRKYICEDIYYGLVTPSALPAAPNEYWYDAALAKELDYDPEKAKWHLKQAGMPGGFAFEATIPVPSAYVEAREAAVVLQANLAEVGIKMNIRQTDFISMYRNAQNGDWTSFPHPSMQSSVEDYLIFNSFHKDGAQNTWGKHFFPDYDAAVEESFRHVAPEKKLPALKRVVKHLVDDCTAVWIGRLNAYHLWRADVTGFEPRYSYFMDLTQARRG